MAKNKQEHILVIRLSAMGDVAMTIPVLLSLTRTYPTLRFTVLTKPFFEPIFSGIPNVTVHIADVKGKHKGILGLWKLYKELKEFNIGRVADLHNVLRSTVLRQFFRLTTIPFVQIDKGRAEKKQLIDPNRTTFKPIKSTINRYCDVFEKLGYPISPKHIDILTKQELSGKASEYAEADSKILLGIAPFAAFKGKMYPAHLMEKVLNTLNDTNKYKIILFGGGKSEGKVLSSWEERFSNTYNAAGVFSFSEELNLISNLDLMLAMDSGNAHLAAMFGVPTLTLWGVTHPYAGFYPFGQPEQYSLLADRAAYPFIPTSIYGNKYPAGYGTAMETIKPEVVVQKIVEILKVVQ